MSYRKSSLGGIVVFVIFLVGYFSNGNLIFADNGKNQELQYFYNQNRLDFIYSEDNSYLDFYYDRNGNLINKIHREFEGFEKGNISATSFMPLIGTLSMTQEPSKVVNGAYSAYGVGEKNVEWTVFMISNFNKFKLEPNTPYSVTFNYKIVDKPANGGYFDFFVRSLTGNGKDDVGWLTWNEAIGTKGSKKVEFVTGANSDYFLNFGMRYGGAISIDDIKVTKEAESFEKGDITATQYMPLIGTLSMTQEPNKVVSGAYSAYGVGEKNVEWTVFMISDFNKFKLEPNTPYSVTFNYKVIDKPANGGYFDFFVRSLTGNGKDDVGWLTWNEAIGTKGSKRVEFVTGANSDYFLNFGMRYGGAISIDDIKVTKEAESFEKGDITATQYMPLIGTLSMSQEPSKVVSGAYSAYGVGEKNVEWTVFMISNFNKFKLEPNTPYSVTFNYKVIDKPASGGYFDFFVRSLTGNGKDDVGWLTWNEAIGTKGSKRVEFVTGANSDYFLNFGMHYGGAISIDDIKVTKRSLQ